METELFAVFVEYPQEGSDLLGIFSTRYLADQEVEKLTNAKQYTLGYLEIYEYILNKSAL